MLLGSSYRWKRSKGSKPQVPPKVYRLNISVITLRIILNCVQQMLHLTGIYFPIYASPIHRVLKNFPVSSIMLPCALLPYLVAYFQIFLLGQCAVMVTCDFETQFILASCSSNLILNLHFDVCLCLHCFCIVVIYSDI
jgi:hypothetical protein